MRYMMIGIINSIINMSNIAGGDNRTPYSSFVAVSLISKSTGFTSLIKRCDLRLRGATKSEQTTVTVVKTRFEERHLLSCLRESDLGETTWRKTADLNADISQST